MALKDEMPKCIECRLRDNPDRLQRLEDMSDFIERKLALARAGVKSEDDLSERSRDRLKALGILPDSLSNSSMDESEFNRLVDELGRKKNE